MNETKIITKYIIFIVAILFFSFGKVHAGEPQERVIFNEIFWSGSFISTSDEFIELKNISSTNIDLTGWQITKINSSGEEELMMEIPDGIIPAGGYFLISNSQKDYNYSNGESILNINPDLVDSAMSLSNDKLQLKIYDGDFSDGRLAIDIAGDGKLPLAGSNENKISMERTELIGDGTVCESWKNASDKINLDAGSIEIANPISSGKPDIINSNINIDNINIAEDNLIELSSEVYDSDGYEDISHVVADFDDFGLGRSDMPFLAINPENNSTFYKLTINIPSNTLSAGPKIIKLTVYDKKGLTAKIDIPIDSYQTSKDIKINEILPAPTEGADKEFIELYNNSQKDVDLYGWQLDDIPDGGSKPYKIDTNKIISAFSYIVFNKSETNIGLNDTGDSVRLLSPEDKQIDFVSYPKASKGFSYNYFNNQWLWSAMPTPGKENIITSSENLNDIISIKEARTKKSNSQVTVVGIVTSIPGNFSNSYFYIEDNTGGIQIYSSKKTFPKLEIGDKIKVTGKTSYTAKGYRIKIYNIDDIAIENKYVIVEPTEINPDDINRENEGKLIIVSGYITKKTGNIIYIFNGINEIRINFKSKFKITKPKLSVGDYLDVVGIIVLYKEGIEILPRFQNDILAYKIYSGKTSKKTSNIILASSNKKIVKNKKIKYPKITSEIDFNKIKKHQNLIFFTELILIIAICSLGFYTGEIYVKK